MKKLTNLCILWSFILLGIASQTIDADSDAEVDISISYNNNTMFIFIDPLATQHIALGDLEIVGQQSDGTLIPLRIGIIFDFLIINDISEPSCFVLRIQDTPAVLVGAPDGCTPQNAKYSVPIPDINTPWIDTINSTALGRINIRLGTQEMSCDLNCDLSMNVPILQAVVCNNSVDTYYERGNQLSEAEDLEAAIGAYQCAVFLEPDNGAFQSSLAWVYYALGSRNQELTFFENAIEHFTLAIDSDLDATDLVGRCFAYTDLGFHEEAIADCHRAIELAPTLFDAYKGLGIANSRSGNSYEALQGYCAYRGLVRVSIETWIEDEISSLENEVGQSCGHIVFTSNRDGNHELYLMNSNGSYPIRLTENTVSDRLAVWSPDGSMIAYTSGLTESTDIYIMEINNGISNIQSFAESEDIDSAPTWSPDGAMIAFYSFRDGDEEIYALNLLSRALQQLTSNDFVDWAPSWSPSGQHITFVSDRDGNFEIYVMNSDGSNQQRLTHTPAGEFRPLWSPDGRQILFMSERDGNRELYRMNADGSNQIRLTDNNDVDRLPAWSPDGDFIIFVSDRDGNEELYIMDTNGEGIVRLTANNSEDFAPAWYR